MIDHEAFIRLDSSVIQWREIAAILIDEGDTTKVKVVLNSGESLSFEGFEAALLWKLFDPEDDWRKT